MNKKIAIIFGVTGQDGYYLTKLLLKKKYIVHGVKRRSSSVPTKRISSFLNQKNFIIHYGDLTDTSSIYNLINTIKPDEIYNLAAQSHVGVSFYTPIFTANVNAIGVLAILEAIRSINNKIKFYQAGTSEMFGKVQDMPQTEKTNFYPLSPYGVAKLYAHWITKNYREAYNIFGSNGILFNHESPRRGETFVTRKITRGLSRVDQHIDKCLYLGNIDSRRDWGHAKDYVEMQWLMLQQDEPDDFVIATGRMETVRKFCELTAKEIGWGTNSCPNGIIWEGEGIHEIGRRADNNEIVIRIDPKYYRPTEVDELIGDASKARKLLNWEPKISLEEIISEMVKEDLEKNRI